MPTLNVPCIKNLSLSNLNSDREQSDNIHNSVDEAINSRDDKMKFTHNFNFFKNIKE